MVENKFLGREEVDVVNDFHTKEEKRAFIWS